MFNFPGFKSTIITVVSTYIFYTSLVYFYPLWESRIGVISSLSIPLLVLMTFFAAQFNRSRIAIACLVWLLFIASQHEAVFWLDWWRKNQSWLILSISLWFTVLALIKDRAFLSIHAVSRIIYFILCAGVSFYWLKFNVEIVSFVSQVNLLIELKEYFPVIFPSAVFGFLLLLLSLKSKDLTVAVLFTSSVIWQLYSSNTLALSAEVICVMVALIYLLVVCIESYFLAYRDDLTGLPTRRALKQLSLSLSRRYTVAMIDIDHFKKFNDTYGHDIGDQVLKLVATKLANIKGGGRVFRYGGEEFTAVFPRKNTEVCLPYLESLRKDVASYDMVIRDASRVGKKFRKAHKSQSYKTVNVTISIGIAQKSSKQHFDQVLKHADLALYRAKKRGRNNVSE